MSDIVQEYTGGKLQGWREDLVPEAKAKYGFMFNDMNRYLSRGPEKVKMMLYDVSRRVLGKDIPNVPQEIGDCVSHGAKHAAEYVQCTQILLENLVETYRSVFAPYYYGSSRVLVGGVHDKQDGSTGTWMAAAVQKFGTLFEDEENVPKYSGKVAKDWGYSGPPKNYIGIAQKYLIKSAALITSWDDLVVAIKNGYPCPTASSIGYSMQASSDGFHRQTDRWNHMMCWIGVDETYEDDPYAILLNNWGNVHGKLKDFQNGEILPESCLRVRKKDVMKHIEQEETYAYSSFGDFPKQDLDKKLFDVIGN